MSPEEWLQKNPQAADTSQLKDPTVEHNSAIKDFLTKPAEDKPFSFKEVGKAMLAGGVVGGGIGAIGGPASAGVGAVGGAIYGGIGDIAEQLTKKAGGSEALALGVGLAAGGGASIVKEIGSHALGKVAGLIPHYSERAAARMAGKAEDATSKALTKVMDKSFGKPDAVLDYAKTANQQATQNVLKAQLEKSGMKVPEGQKVSDYLRDDLYSQMEQIKPLKDTLPAQRLNQDLDALVQRGQATKTEKAHIMRALSNQTSKNPDVAKEANRDLLNLAQSGGVYQDLKGEATRKIGEAAQNAFKTRFGEYLSETRGSDIYDTLKKVERTEIVAKVRDGIPQLLGGGMKPAAIQEVGRNIAATPEGKQEFIQAFSQHLGALPMPKNVTPQQASSILMKEVRKVAPVLKETKILSGEQINQMQKIINSLPKEVDVVKKQMLINNMIRSAFTSSVGATTAEGSGEQQ